MVLVVSACSGGDDQADGPTPSPPQGTSPTATPTSDPSPTSLPSAEGAGTPLRVRADFFGMHDGRVTQGRALGAAGSLRLWDAGTTWLDLETSPGVFSWGPLDTAVATAEEVDARPLLVLGQTPTFHASRPREEAAYGPGAASMPDLAAWRRYVTAVAARYGDRIDYQVWNEPNVVGFWTGTPRQMAELTLTASRTIHKVVPQATVVAPSFPLRLPGQRRYFADFWSWQSRVDLASAVDAAAVHLYPLAEGAPEAQVRLLDKARTVLAEDGVELPVWNTEINYGLGGGVEPPSMPAEQQRAFLMRTYLLNAGLGVHRAYWYRWDLTSLANTFLITPDLTAPTLAGQAFSTVRSWLEGTVVEGCEASDGVWSCTARAGGETRTFWWKPRGAPTRMPAGADAQSWTDASGSVTPCRDRCQVRVGQTPLMVTARSGA